MRRRRKNRSTWFPVLGTEGEEGKPLNSVYTLNQTVELAYDIAMEVTPLIPDYTNDPSTTGADVDTLRDFVEGQTCIIDRIVGKIAVGLNQLPGSGSGFNTAACVVACAAIAVLPVDDDGIAITTATGEQINPLAAENLDKPWMWRRTWTLTNRLATGSGIQQYNYGFPTSNCEYGSVMDGPHIDTKGVKRAIQRNQRIFLILANQDKTPGEPNENTELRWVVDLRVLGRMQKARNKSLFT